MSMANHPRLPLEVIEQIIDKVASKSKRLGNNYKQFDDLPSLTTCALVCHSFLDLCRKHIFATVTLNGRRPVSPTSDDLNQLLLDSPHLAFYIRKLVYLVNNKKEFVRKRLSWLTSMFQKLVKLTKLKMGYAPAGLGRRLDWMSPPERKILLPLLHIPTLTSIYLCTIDNFVLADLAVCANVKKLRIGSLDCLAGGTDAKYFPEILPPKPLMLDRLVIHNGNVKPFQRLCEAKRPDGKPIFDFSSLKKFESTAERLDSMSDLLRMCKNLHKFNLQRMSFTRTSKPLFHSQFYSKCFFTHYIYIVSDHVNRNHEIPTPSLKGLFTMLRLSLPTLVDIEIEYYIDSDDESHDGPLAGLCYELEKMSGQNIVKTIQLRIWVKSGRYNCTRWAMLDDILLGSPQDWPALTNVSIKFLLTNSPGEDSDKELRELPMTKLMQSNRVQFDSSVFRTWRFESRPS